MSEIKKNINDAGEYKELITSALFENEKIRNMILGEGEADKWDMISQFKDKVKSHLFVDDTVLKTDTYIFYDIYVPYVTERVKTNKLVMYCICHRDVLDNYVLEGYHGNRADILSKIVEETLLDEKIVGKFGIGKLGIDGVNIYNASRFYGRVIEFSIPNFR